MRVGKLFFSKELFFISILTFLFASISPAKSLYVGMHKSGSLGGYVSAYKIINEHLQYQANSQGDMNEWTGMTLDPCSGMAFATSEMSDPFTGDYNIHLLNTRTAIFEETQTKIEGATGPHGLAGVVFDQSKQKLYIIDRETKHLFVYLWKPELKGLFPENETYKELYLGVYITAYGLALDVNRNILYVTNSSNIVHYFDTNTWEHKGSITISTGHNQAVGIALDSKRHYMYTGSFTGGSGDHTYLVRTDINDPNNPTFSEKNLGTNNYVIGLAMDEDTGYLYVGSRDQKVRVFNALTWPSDACDVNGAAVYSPAGMCLGDNIEYKPPKFNFSKVDTNNPHSVLPGDNITYRITYGPNGISHNNVVITDYLPREVNFLNPSDPNYNAFKHTYTWNIGLLSAGAANNSFDINVQVNNGAAPGGVITNYCEIESDVACNAAKAKTNVGSWQPNSSIIYVDCFSPCSPGTGMSWQYAYRDLQDALDRSAAGYGSQIWAANGIYRPSILDPCDQSASSPTFVIYKGVPIYGHFVGNEMSLSQRNFNNPNTQSILSGVSASSLYVVTVSNRDSGNVLDGFKISGSSYSGAGIRINDANLYIANCLITLNYDGIKSNDSNFTVFDCNICNNSVLGVGYGIDATDSHFTVAGSVIQNNEYYGIYGNFENTGNAWKTTVKNSIIRNNPWGGIYFQNVKSPVDILNNLINNNYNGIYFSAYNGYEPNLTVQNNTIVKNENLGITAVYSSSPIIRNCIFKGNLYEIDSYGSMALPTYCCIEEDYPGQYSDIYIGQGSIFTDPCFVGYDINNFHLDPNSLCIDAGNPDANYSGQTDIDGQPRVMLGKSHNRVDIGADEFLKTDYNGDSIVNFIDFAYFAAKWRMTDPNISLDDNNDVNICDLKIFCQFWLWISPFSSFYQSFMSELQMGEMDSTLSTSSEQASSPQVEQPADMEFAMAEELQQQQQLMLLDEEQLPVIWLTCDGNMNPAYGQEVTVYVFSEQALLAMDVTAEVTGNANITAAMGTADCNDYGWDLDWNIEPEIDPAGHWAKFSDVSWDSIPTGTVGYFKFRYYGGEVTVFIDEKSIALNPDSELVTFSLEPLVFVSDPNQ